ncbi:MAG TPA: DUF6265 family protein [Cyclobacteriaceae bacterium]|nr:DUF6265 family protein [Cyclobacteriaceae bacterium]
MTLCKSITSRLLLPLSIAVALMLSGGAPIDSIFSRLLILEGTWKMETRKGPLFEQWQKFDESTLRGLSYRISGNDTILLERLELVSRPDGVFYIPAVVNQNDGEAVSFKLVASENNRFVFENKAHDFPQRIIYSLVTADSIAARIEGISGGKEASSDFYYRRVSAN